jgi:hypothetical protein
MAIRKSSSSGIPFGNTAGRPANANVGQPYFNGEVGRLELKTSASWENIIQEVPGVSGISGTYSEQTNSATIAIAGTNFAPGTIASAIGTNQVEVLATSTTYNSLVQVTAVFTGLSNANEPYDIKVTNPSNLFGVIPAALYINASPVWATSAGSLGTFTEQVSISVSATATDSDSTITYALASGSTLPSGISLNSSTGLISGTLPDVASNTTYTFTINASDGVNTIPRAFSITSNALVAISTAETLVVAGGGGGGSNGNTTGGGGGGAGGYLYSASTSFTPGTAYTLSIGTGGVGRNQSTNSPSSGSKGGNSEISGSGLSTIQSAGGGAGGSGPAVGGNSGGSGGSGGVANNFAPGGAGNTPSVSPSQGNNAGSSQTFYVGAGGGAGSAGGNSSFGVSGPYGQGATSSITGTSVERGWGAGNGAPTPGGANTGSGHGQNSSGGSGVVILSIKKSNYTGFTTGSPTVTTVGSNVVLQFTGSGTYTA